MAKLTPVLLMFLPSACVGLLDDNKAYPHHQAPLYDEFSSIYKACDWNARADTMGGIFEHPVMNHYKTTKHWMNYTGTRIIPEQSESGWHFTQPWKKYPFEERGIQGSRCRLPQPDGTTWSLERVGPFRSTGDYDWLQMAWSNALQLSEELRDYKDGLYLLQTLSVATNEQGEILNFPPVHVHHAHFTGGPRNIFVVSPFCESEKGLLGMHTDVDCELEKRAGLSWVHEMHADYGCNDAEGGVKCMIETFPDGYAKLVKNGISFDADYNDVRAGGSPTMTWYVTIGARWIPNDMDVISRSSLIHKPRPISLHTIANPGRMDINDQSTMVHTMLMPTDKETFTWYTGRMLFSGSLIRGKSHTHNQIFQQMFMFTGEPKDIGLTDKFRPAEKACDPVVTKSVGFASNLELRDYILAEYRANGASRIVCEVNQSYDVIDGYIWDRRAKAGCNPWEFKEGDQFTVIGFNGLAPGLKSAGPHMPNQLPTHIPVHLSWFWLFDTHDDESHWAMTVHTQDVDHSYQISLHPTWQILGTIYAGGDQSQNKFRSFLYGSIATITAVAMATVGLLYTGVRKMIKSD